MALGYFQKNLEEIYLFQNPVEKIVTKDPKKVLSLLEKIEKQCEDNQLYALGYLTYESASGLRPYLKVKKSKDNLLDFTLFQNMRKESLQNSHPQRAFLSRAESQWAFEDYSKAFSKVKGFLKEGESYQVNLTFPHKGKVFWEKDEQESLFHLWLALMKAQGCQYGGLYWGESKTVLSLSPELFFSKCGSMVQCRPMKGTRANPGPTLLHQVKTELSSSQKDRAENLMIVDMIRSDLGQIAKAGSLKVPKLFEVEEYPTVLQMITEVEAQTDHDLAQIFQALFPCPSVTGAPKKKTMDIIHELEPHLREVYTGAFGYIAPGGQALFNVPIRTLEIEPKGSYTYCTGSGVVWDSEGPGEYEESLVKSKVLQGGWRNFDFIEALLLDPKEGFLHLEDHLKRMAASARELGEVPQIDQWREQAKTFFSSLRPEKPRKIRMVLSPSGTFSLEDAGEGGRMGPVPYTLASGPLEGHTYFLRHKTSRRGLYERFAQEKPSGGQVILYTQEGFLTEGTTANLYLLMNGQWLTPPASLPLLKGCFRERLLQKKEVKEALLTLEDLKKAQSLAFSNDVRGWMVGVPTP